jgi:hypothetical protein
MQTRERQLIQDLFDRLRSAEGQRRDPEVERLIADELRHVPHASYAMAQTIIAQNAALETAARRIEQLENGGNYADDEDNDTPQRGAMGAPDLGAGRRGSVPSFGCGAAAQHGAQYGGGGFLANAGQIAMGVAGGMLLTEAAKSLFGSGSDAQAATSDASPAATDSGQLGQDAGVNDISGSEGGSAESAGGNEGGGGLFGWLFGSGENDNGHQDNGHETADAGWDDGGGDSGE